MWPCRSFCRVDLRFLQTLCHLHDTSIVCGKQYFTVLTFIKLVSDICTIACDDDFQEHICSFLCRTFLGRTILNQYKIMNHVYWLIPSIMKCHFLTSASKWIKKTDLLVFFTQVFFCIHENIAVNQHEHEDFCVSWL